MQIYRILLQLVGKWKVLQKDAPVRSWVTGILVGNGLIHNCRYEFSLNFLILFLFFSITATKYVCKIGKGCGHPSWVTGILDLGNFYHCFHHCYQLTACGRVGLLPWFETHQGLKTHWCLESHWLLPRLLGTFGRDFGQGKNNLGLGQAPKTSLSYRSGSFIPRFILSHQYVNKYNAI